MTWQRRMFLRGAGGAALAIPCLASLLPRRARAAYVPPRRFVALSADLGVYENLWYPAGYKRQLPAGQAYTERDLAALPGSVSQIIGPAFDDLKPKLLLLRGLDSALHFPNSNGHMRSTTLTGTYLNMGAQVGPSIDIVLSRSPKVKLASTPIAHVSCGITGSENHSFYVDQGKMKAPFMYTDGKQLFQFLFGSYVAAPGVDPQALLRKKTLLIDSVLDHYRALSRSPRLGANDRRVLDEFATSFAGVETRLRDVKPLQCTVTTPDLQAYKSGDPTQYERRMKETLDILSLALKCGIVQVAQFGLPTPEDGSPPPESNYAIFSNLSTAAVPFTLPAHSYSHEIGNSKQTNPIYQAWLATFAAYFMKSLDVPESESPYTFLDNSFVLYHNNLSNGSLHTRIDLPTLVGGSLGGRIATGKMLDYTQNMPYGIQNASGKNVGIDYNRWLVTILQAFGLAEADYQQPGMPPGFGSDARFTMCPAALDTSARRQPLPGILKSP